MKAQKVVIKKYGNRRLYDTAGSRYVNLDEVARLLRDGASRVVVATYLLAPGLFADRIRHAALAAGAAAVSPALGACAEVADVMLDRFAQAGSTRRTAA